MEITHYEHFFQMISTRYGNNYKTFMKSWINDKKRICTAIQQLIFLLRCRRYDLVLSHIQNLKVNIFFYSNSVNHHNFNLNYLRAIVKKTKKRLLDGLPRELILRFFDLYKHKILLFNHRIKNNLTKKFSKLISKHNTVFNPFDNIDNSRWLVNISNKNVPERVYELLNLGDNFGLPLQQSHKKDGISIALVTSCQF
ncbi:hypothetical protein ACFW04_012522 [Cataglyphis niger]